MSGRSTLMCPLRPAWHQTGVTLIELIIFIVIVSAALAGVLSVLNITVKSSADPMLRKQALAIAEAMMEEILLKDYENDVADPTNVSATLGCTPNTTTPRCRANTLLERQYYNDVSDYAGWDQSGVYGLDGSAVTGLGSYRVQVVVAAGATWEGVTAKQITVTVTGASESIVLNGFRTSYE